MAAVVASFHFEGADQGTSIVDSSGKTWSITGAPVTQTQETWVGTSSGYFPGTGYLTHASHPDFQFGTGDFTIRGLVRCTDSTATVRHMFGNSFAAGGNSGYYLYWQQGVITFGYQTADLVYHQVNSAALGVLSIYNRYYIEITRADGVLTMRVNDTITASLDDVSGNVIGRDAPVYLGYSTSAYGSPFKGYMDEFQVIKGAAIHVTFAAALAGLPDSLAPDGPIVSASLQLTVIAAAMASASLTLHASIVPPGILAGTQSVCIGSGAAAIWTPVVRVAGTDVASQTISEIRVEAEENASRISEIVLRPPAGSTMYLPEWSGKTLTIDVADAATGSPRWPMRLFSGVVDTPTLDLASRTLSLSATNDLQGRCLAMTQAALTALIGGYYSAAVFDAAADGWAYAQDRLSTRTASIDISPQGALRVTPWEPKAVADIALDESLIYDGSLSISLSPRSALTNAVDVNFGYRFPRVKAEGHGVSFEAVNMTNFAQYNLESRAFLQRAQVEAAISAAGGTLMDIVYTPLPTVDVPVGTGFWSPGPYDDQLCMGFTATVSFDFAATIEEQHQIRVAAQNSIDVVGLRLEAMSGALVGEYPDLTAAETGIKLYKAAVTSIPPADVAATVLDKTTAAEVTLTPETNRDAANAAMETLIAIAKAKIWSSHRGNTITLTVPLMPAIDVDKTVSVAADGVTAKGKVRRVVHIMRPETGEAYSEVAIALCSVAGVGITHDETATAAPSGTVAGQTDLSLSPTVVFNSGPTEDNAITITFPAVAEAERNGTAIILPSTFDAPLVEDVFTVTIGS